MFVDSGLEIICGMEDSISEMTFGQREKQKKFEKNETKKETIKATHCIESGVFQELDCFDSTQWKTEIMFEFDVIREDVRIGPR